MTIEFSCLLPEPLLVLIEYVPYGDLLGYLRKSRGLNDTYYKDPNMKPQTNLTSQQLMEFAWQIANGMSYLSSRSVSKPILLVRYPSPSPHFFIRTSNKQLCLACTCIYGSYFCSGSVANCPSHSKVIQALT